MSIDPGPQLAAPEPRPIKPQRYGRYILLDKIGTGGMAEVFRALVLGPQRFQRIIVVKRILPEISEDPRFVQMFIDEANICARLSHPNVVQIYEFGTIGVTHFIAMEHVHGRNLRAVLAHLTRAGRAMPPAVAADVARQVCLGLDYAHTLTSADGQPLGIIHRDISPTNIMISFTGGVKVLDFGIARAARELAGGTTSLVKGKMSYVAPEQIQFGEVDRRADVFALGVVLHEALTGHRLFKAEHDAERAKLVLQMPIPRPSSRNPAVPPALDRIVMHALERNPARRYGSAADMAADLERFLLDARHSAQETVTMLRELFAREMTAANELGIPKAELQALVATVAAGAPPAAGGFEGSERTGTGTGTSTGSVLSASDASLGTPAPEQAAASTAPRRRHGSRRRTTLAVAAALAMLSTGVAVGLWLAGMSPLGRSASHVRISFDSSPQEARVYYKNTPDVLGTTPFALELPRGTHRLVFHIELEGHVPATLKVLPDFDKPVFVTLSPHGTPPPPPARQPAPR